MHHRSLPFSGGRGLFHPAPHHRVIDEALSSINVLPRALQIKYLASGSRYRSGVAPTRQRARQSASRVG